MSESTARVRLESDTPSNGVALEHRWVRRRRSFAQRPPVARRHVIRSAARVLTLAASDLLFSYAATITMGVLAAWQIPGATDAGAIAALIRGGSTEPLYFAASLLFGLLLTGNYRLRQGMHPAVDTLAGCTLAVTLAYWAAFRIHAPVDMIAPFVLTTVILWLWIAVGRNITARLIHRVLPSASGVVPAVVIGTEAQYEEALASEQATAGWRLVGFVTPDGVRSPNALGTVSQLPAVAAAHEIETVLVMPQKVDLDLDELFDVALAAGCTLLYPARALQVAGMRPNLVWRVDEPFFELGAFALRGEEVFLKRLIDVIGAAIGIVLVSPLLIVVALVIKLDSPGPIFFIQPRAGLYGRRFRMLKFRTMRAGADREKLQVAHLNQTGDPRLFKIADDPRVTRIGRWLRRWSIDELPQLWNVLVGDMALVGPRPFFETDLADYEAHHFRRLDVKPGITGLWQVSGRSEVVDFDEVVKLDRRYIEHWSLWLDLKILAMTLPAVLRRRGAY